MRSIACPVASVAYVCAGVLHEIRPVELPDLPCHRVPLMFTGIIRGMGTVARLERRGGDARLHVDARLETDDVQLGDSIAVSGICLTAVALQSSLLSFDVSNETLSLTTLGRLAAGDLVNLEPALRLVDRLGGHLVSGHVDGVGKVLSVSADARSQRWTFEVPAGLGKYIAPKGSVCIDGISLTVNEVDGLRFGVNLVPHTVAHTTFQGRHAGDPVNIEVDMLARYVERLLGAGEGPRVDHSFLRQHGFT